MKRTFTLLCMLMLLALSAKVYAQATCGGPCGGFSGGSTSIQLNVSTQFSTTYTSNYTWSVSPGLTIVSTGAGTINIKGTSVGTNHTLCLTYNSAGVVCSVCRIINVINCPSTPTVGFAWDPFLSTLKATTQFYSGFTYTWYVNGNLYAGPTANLSQIAWVSPAYGTNYGDSIQVSVTINSGSCQRSSACKRVLFTGSGTSGVVDDGACKAGGGVERIASPEQGIDPNEIPLRNNKGVSRVFPNPARNRITLTFEDDAKHAIEIVDASGTVVLTETVTGKEYTADISKLKKGEYYVRQRSATGKEIVNRLLIE